MADYFRIDARSGARLCARRADRRAVVPARQGRHDPRADRRAHRPGAVRAVLRLCRRPLRDGRADVAGRAGAAARTQRRRCPRWSRPSPRSANRSFPAQLARWLDALDETGRWALLKLVTGALRIGVSARLAKTAAASLGDKDPTRSKCSGPGCAALRRAVRLAGRPRREARQTRDPAPFRPAMLAHAHRGDAISPRSTPPTSRRMEMGRHPRAGGRRRGEDGTRDRAALFAHRRGHLQRAFPTWSRRCDFRGAIDGELLIVRERPRADLQRAAAAAQPQSRHAEAAARISRSHPRLRSSGRRRRRPARRCRSPSAARGWRTSSRGSTIRASTSRRWCRSRPGTS